MLVVLALLRRNYGTMARTFESPHNINCKINSWEGALCSKVRSFYLQLGLFHLRLVLVAAGKLAWSLLLILGKNLGHSGEEGFA